MYFLPPENINPKLLRFFWPQRLDVLSPGWGGSPAPAGGREFTACLGTIWARGMNRFLSVDTFFVSCCSLDRGLSPVPSSLRSFYWLHLLCRSFFGSPNLWTPTQLVKRASSALSRPAQTRDDSPRSMCGVVGSICGSLGGQGAGCGGRVCCGSWEFSGKFSEVAERVERGTESRILFKRISVNGFHPGMFAGTDVCETEMTHHKMFSRCFCVIP